MRLASFCERETPRKQPRQGRVVKARPRKAAARANHAEFHKAEDVSSSDTVAAQNFVAGFRLLDRVTYKDRTFILSTPIRYVGSCTFNVDGSEEWQAEIPSLGLFAFGDSREALLADLYEDFAATWDGLAYETDASLTDDAKALKYLLRSLVEAIKK